MGITIHYHARASSDEQIDGVTDSFTNRYTGKYGIKNVDFL